MPLIDLKIRTSRRSTKFSCFEPSFPQNAHFFAFGITGDYIKDKHFDKKIVLVLNIVHVAQSKHRASQIPYGQLGLNGNEYKTDATQRVGHLCRLFNLFDSQHGGHLSKVDTYSDCLNCVV